MLVAENMYIACNFVLKLNVRGLQVCEHHLHVTLLWIEWLSVCSILMLNGMMTSRNCS